MNQNEAVLKLLKIKDKITFFKNLEDDEIVILLKNVIFKKYIRNEIIFSQGEDKDDYIYYILKGYVNITFKNTNSSTKKIATVYESSLIGELKPILKEGRIATCVAGSVGAIVIGFIIEQKHIDLNPNAYAKFYKNIAHILAKKIQDMNESV